MLSAAAAAKKKKVLSNNAKGKSRERKVYKYKKTNYAFIEEE